MDVWTYTGPRAPDLTQVCASRPHVIELILDSGKATRGPDGLWEVGLRPCDAGRERFGQPPDRADGDRGFAEELFPGLVRRRCVPNIPTGTIQGIIFPWPKEIFAEGEDDRPSMRYSRRLDGEY
jgi:hypothetical protein